MNVVIEKNIPVPARKTNDKSSQVRVALLSLCPGDSFLLKSRGVINSYIQAAKTTHPDRSFTTRKTDIGVRVWRVK